MKHYLICYDIRNKKRLTRVHKKLLSIGIPLQFSVFYAHIDETSLEDKISELSEIIEQSEDDIRIYCLHSFDISIWKKANVNRMNQALLVT